MTHKDKHGTLVSVGDIIGMERVPRQFDVRIKELTDCEDGCLCGGAVIDDPESGEEDTVCLSVFVKRN